MNTTEIIQNRIKVLQTEREIPYLGQESYTLLEQRIFELESLLDEINDNKEYNLRERAEIVNIAIECSKSLSAQPLIDYFNKNK